MSVGKQTALKARSLFSRGLSVPEVVQALSQEQMFPITEPEVHSLQEIYAETLRKQAQNQRMILRTQLRDSVVPAVQVLKNILLKPMKVDSEGKLLAPIFVAGEKELLRLKLEAARVLIAAGAKFADDNIINVFTEKPEADATSDISFDYVSTIRNDGATVLTPVVRKGHLSLLKGGPERIEDLF
jgi:hypothetical protein